MKTTPIKYFVVSLPRTGTKSLCKMADAVGIGFSHAPSVSLQRTLHSTDVRFFADTPLYAPSHISHVIVNKSHKFIYIDREFDKWKDSFERVKLNINYDRLLKLTKLNAYTTMDRNCLREIFDGKPYDPLTVQQLFQQHKDIIYDMVPSDRLLTYNFSMGWDPFCEFLDVPVPDMELPHINKNTMFEPL